MSKNTVNTQIPFCGYFESILSDHANCLIENFVDYIADPVTYSHYGTSLIENADLRAKIEALDPNKVAHELSNILWRYENTLIEHENEINRRWVYIFCESIKQEYDVDLMPDLTTVSMSSPKYYNFETDRLFCNVDFEAIKKLYIENKELCDSKIHERMKPRDGFIPFYSNDTNDWGDFDGWDYNQWGLILYALQNDDIYDWVIDDMLDWLNCNVELSIRTNYDDLFNEVLEKLTE